MAKAEIFNLRSLETVEGIPEEENMHSVFANISKFFFFITCQKKCRQRQNRKRYKVCNYKRRQYYDP